MQGTVVASSPTRSRQVRYLQGGRASRRHHAQRVLLVAAAVALTGLLQVVIPPPSPPSTSSASAQLAGALPFVLPSAQVLRSSPRLVFAHYFPPFPLSIDNKAPALDFYAREYLTPDGENGKHKDYGGLLRDRPLPRPPRTQDDWRLRDMRKEVQQALTAGLDGFTVDILQLPGGSDERLWTRPLLLLQAAADVDPGFKIMLMPDMSGGLRRAGVKEFASRMAELATYRSAYRLADGRLVIAPFLADRRPVGWWRDFIDVMRQTHGIRVALVPLFLDEQVHERDFAPISYGMSHWGARNPQWNDPEVTFRTSRLGRVQRVHASGKPWMQPVSVQDERPAAGVFDEAENTQNLRDTWRVAIDSGSEWVQLVTWNDYSEGTSFAPSVNHGWSFLDISAYYLAWYKLGAPPPIVRDTVYLTHRTQLVEATPSGGQKTLMVLRGGSPARDTIEALTFLRAPATVVVTAGSKRYTCKAAAGVDTCVVPLSVGRVAARVERDGAVVAKVVSPYAVVTSSKVQDLQYVAASSARQSAAR